MYYILSTTILEMWSNTSQDYDTILYLTRHILERRMIYLTFLHSNHDSRYLSSDVGFGYGAVLYRSLLTGIKELFEGNIYYYLLPQTEDLFKVSLYREKLHPP